MSISGATVTLTLNPAIRAGDTVTVSYTRPTTNRLKDKAGNDADAFPSRTVTNNTPVREPDRSTGLEASPGNALVDLEWAQPE